MEEKEAASDLTRRRPYAKRIPTTTIPARDRKKHDPEDLGSREAGQHQSRFGRARSADAGSNSPRSRARNSGGAEWVHAASGHTLSARTHRRRLSAAEPDSGAGDRD